MRGSMARGGEWRMSEPRTHPGLSDDFVLARGNNSRPGNKVGVSHRRHESSHWELLEREGLGVIRGSLEAIGVHLVPPPPSLCDLDRSQPLD